MDNFHFDSTMAISMVGPIKENKMTGHELIARIVNTMDDLNKEIICHEVWREAAGNSVVKTKDHHYHFINGKIFVENEKRIEE